MSVMRSARFLTRVGIRGTLDSALFLSASSYDGRDVATLYDGGLG